VEDKDFELKKSQTFGQLGCGRGNDHGVTKDMIADAFGCPQAIQEVWELCLKKTRRLNQ
jgi:hypothetical protein